MTGVPRHMRSYICRVISNCGNHLRDGVLCVARLGPFVRADTIPTRQEYLRCHFNQNLKRTRPCNPTMTASVRWLWWDGVIGVVVVGGRTKMTGQNAHELQFKHQIVLHDIIGYDIKLLLDSDEPDTLQLVALLQ